MMTFSVRVLVDDSECFMSVVSDGSLPDSESADEFVCYQATAWGMLGQQMNKQSGQCYSVAAWLQHCQIRE